MGKTIVKINHSKYGISTIDFTKKYICTSKIYVNYCIVTIYNETNMVI